MTSIIFDTKKIEKDLKKIIENKTNELQIMKSAQNEGGNMVILNQVERELLSIIIMCEQSDYSCHGTDAELPVYISDQLKDLFFKLKCSGYIASYNIFMGGMWTCVLTPLGKNYFEKEEEYKTSNMKTGATFNINTLNANGSNINFGNVYDSSFNIDNSYNELERLIDEKGNEDKEELKAILEEVKDYIENINQSKSIGKNKSLFTKIGDHFEKHQWFYQSVVTLLGSEIIKIMSGN